MDTLWCELCKHTCLDARALKAHVRDCHDGKAGRVTALPCPRPDCNSRLMTRTGFQRHLKGHAIKDIRELGYALDDQTLTTDELLDFGLVREAETEVDEEEGQVDMCPFCGKELPTLDTLAHHLVHHVRQRAAALIRMDQHAAEEAMDIVEIVEIIPGIRYGGCGKYDVMTTRTLSSSRGHQQNSRSSWNARAIQDFEDAIARLSREMDLEDRRATRKRVKEDRRASQTRAKEVRQATQTGAKGKRQTPQARAKEDLTRATGSANTAEYILSFLQPVVSTDFGAENEQEEVLLRIKRPGEVSRIRAI